MGSIKRKHRTLPPVTAEEDEHLAQVTAAVEKVLNSPEMKASLSRILGTSYHFTVRQDSSKPAFDSHPKSKQSNPRSAPTYKTESRKETEQ
jgi:hypothetical protein